MPCTLAVSTFRSNGFAIKIITAHVDCHDDAHIIRSGRKEKHRYFRHFPDLLAPVVTVKKREDECPSAPVADRLRQILSAHRKNPAHRTPPCPTKPGVAGSHLQSLRHLSTIIIRYIYSSFSKSSHEQVIRKIPGLNFYKTGCIPFVTHGNILYKLSRFCPLQDTARFLFSYPFYFRTDCSCPEQLRYVFMKALPIL